MSYVEVFVVEANGNVVSYGEAHNNHGFAPLIWMWLGEKHNYLDGIGYFLADPGLEKLMNEIEEPKKLSRTERILLAVTADRVWAPMEFLPELINGVHVFLTDYVIKRDRVRTAEGVEMMLREIQEMYPTALGVAFNCCSALSPFWVVRESDDGESRRPYNILKDKEQPHGEYKGKSAENLSEFFKEG